MAILLYWLMNSELLKETINGKMRLPKEIRKLLMCVIHNVCNAFIIKKIIKEAFRKNPGTTTWWN